MDNKKLILLDKRQVYNPVHLVLWANKFMFYGTETDAFNAYKLEINNMCHRNCIDKNEFMTYLKNIKFNENIPIDLNVLLESMINKKEDAIVINGKKYYSLEHACKVFKLNFNKEMESYELMKAGGVTVEEYLLHRYREVLNLKLKDSSRRYLRIVEKCNDVPYADGLYETYKVECNRCGFIGTMTTKEISEHKCRKA